MHKRSLRSRHRRLWEGCLVVHCIVPRQLRGRHHYWSSGKIHILPCYWLPYLYVSTLFNSNGFKNCYNRFSMFPFQAFGSFEGRKKEKKANYRQDMNGVLSPWPTGDSLNIFISILLSYCSLKYSVLLKTQGLFQSLQQYPTPFLDNSFSAWVLKFCVSFFSLHHPSSLY